MSKTVFFEISAILKLESDTEGSNDGFSLINAMPDRISTKRKSTRMDEESPSKVQASNAQFSSNVNNNTASQRVITQELSTLFTE